MSVAQNRAARHRIQMKFGKNRFRRSVHEAIAAERARAMSAAKIVRKK